MISLVWANNCITENHKKVKQTLCSEVLEEEWHVMQGPYRRSAEEVGSTKHVGSRESQDSWSNAFIGGQGDVHMKKNERTALLHLKSLGHS